MSAAINYDALDALDKRVFLAGMAEGASRVVTHLRSGYNSPAYAEMQVHREIEEAEALL